MSLQIVRFRNFVSDEHLLNYRFRGRRCKVIHLIDKKWESLSAECLLLTLMPEAVNLQIT